MHRFFTIPELILIVARELDEKEDLYCFGATCQQIWSVVETELWCDISDVMFNSLVPKIETTGDGWPMFSDSLVRRCGLVKYVDLTAPENYSWDASVKELSDVSTLLLGWDKFQDAMMFICTGPTFHNLRWLRLLIGKGHPAHVVQSLFPVLPGNIQRLDLILIDPETWRSRLLVGFVLTLKRLKLRLHELQIQPIGSTHNHELYLPVKLCSDLELAYTEVFKQNPALREEMRFLSLLSGKDGCQLLPVLSGFPTLKYLDLPLTSDNEIAPYDLPETAFPNLTTVILPSDDSTYHPHLIPFFQSLPSAEVREVVMTVKDIKEGTTVFALLAARWMATLDKISTTIKTHENHDLDTFPPLSTILAPLFPVRNLTRLYLYHESCFSLDVNNIRKLISAFPLLEDLDLGLDLIPLEASGAQMRPRTGRRVLSAVVGGLPRLAFLGISIDFDFNDGGHEAAADAAVTSTLIRLDLGASCCNNPNSTTNLLCFMFPKLEYLNCGEGLHMEWVKTVMALPADDS